MSPKSKTTVTLQSWIDLQIGPTQSNGEFETPKNNGKTKQSFGSLEQQEDTVETTARSLLVRQKVERWLATFFLLLSEDEVRMQAQQLNEEIEEANSSTFGSLLPQTMLDQEKLCKRWRVHNAKCA
tara:strand:- start:67 stop:444 length:378 start_codon:yes stop_codon:yes gene_type:complete